MGLAANLGDARPTAYLNYILFDRNYNFLDMGWSAVPATAMSQQQISIPTVTVKEPGYIFVYLSYETASNNWVQFDDFKVTHTKTRVIQYNDYYPFGMQASTSWTRDNNKNNFLYDAAGELNSTTGWYDLFYRNYDPVLGRFMQIDPLAHAYADLSPFNYAGNNPVLRNDPLGDKISQSGGGSNYLQRYAATWHSSTELDRPSHTDIMDAYYESVADESKSDKGANGGSGFVTLVAKEKDTGFEYVLHVMFEDGKITDVIAANAGVSGNTPMAIAFAFGLDGTGGFGGKDPNSYGEQGVVLDQAGIWTGGTDGFDQAGIYLGLKGLGTDLMSLSWKYASNTSKSQQAHEIHKILRNNFLIKANDIKVPKTGVIKAAIPGVLKGAGVGLGVLAGGVTIGQVIYNREIKASNVLDASITVASFIPVVGWVIGGGYFLTDVGVRLITDKSIGEHLDESLANGGSLYKF